MNRLTIVPDRLERLRKLCLLLPETLEKETWGDPTWRVRDRIFVMQKGNYEGGQPSIWLKVELGGQELLVDSRGELFFVPPYVGHKGWVGIRMDVKRIPWTLVADLIRDSYCLIAPKRLAVFVRVAAVHGAPEPSRRRKSSPSSRSAAAPKGTHRV